MYKIWYAYFNHVKDLSKYLSNYKGIHRHLSSIDTKNARVYHGNDQALFAITRFVYVQNPVYHW